MSNVFERRLSFPDLDAKLRYARLVGIDSIKTRLAKTIVTLINYNKVTEWKNKFHPDASLLLDYFQRRPPFVILQGDVGTGKTEIAETVGDCVARFLGSTITLLPLSLSARGTGKVGEMTQLISAVFDETFRLSESCKNSNNGIILFVDEGDAIVASRSTDQMHHEDKSGVNAFIRGIDRLANNKLPAVVILSTNRLKAIDPAVKRRAAEIFTFERPNREQRFALLSSILKDIGFVHSQIDSVVKLTGETKERSYGFTYSDLTQRFVPGLVLSAFSQKRISFEDAEKLLKTFLPTPPFDQD